MASQAARHLAREVAADLGAVLLGFVWPMAVLIVVGLPSGLTVWLAVNVLSVIPFIFLVVAAHETAHALVGRVVGMKPFRILLGSGRTIFEARIGECRVDVHARFFGGFTFLGTSANRWVRLRFWVSIAAGPAFSVALVLLLTHIRGNRDFAELSTSWSVSAVVWFASAFVAAGSVIPFHLRTGGFKRSSQRVARRRAFELVQPEAE
jgi:hypothetical protein